MDKSKKGKSFNLKKKIIAPVYISEETINKKFLLAVNEFLFILMEENKRKTYIDKYTLVQQPLGYLSPLYFASAIAFLDKYPKGPNETDFDDKSLNEYVNRLFSTSNTAIKPNILKLRRKMEFLRYIRLLININSRLP